MAVLLIGIGVILTLRELNTIGRGIHACYYYARLQILGGGYSLLSPYSSYAYIWRIHCHAGAREMAS